MVVDKGKEYRFTLNFNMPRSFTPRKSDLQPKNGEQPVRLPNGLLHPRVEVEQRTHSGDEIGTQTIKQILSLFWSKGIWYLG